MKGREKGRKKTERCLADSKEVVQKWKSLSLHFKNSHPFSSFQGGLKAVVWTDAFQMVVMIVGFLTVLIQGSNRAGGLHSVLEQAENGSRLYIFEYVHCYFFLFYLAVFSCMTSSPKIIFEYQRNVFVHSFLSAS